jgi:serine phosphatase RsbU (regulator of sigma subunit)
MYDANPIAIPAPLAGSNLSSRELTSARAVQARFQQPGASRLLTLEYAGRSLPAGDLGGDFYDFLRPTSRRLALALGDVSGKGLPAALMMASLLASLRSQYAAGWVPLARMLASVNRLFFECTAEGHFATLFLGEYDDRTRRLRYANCGHVPPLLLRADGVLERLGPTAMVLGIREDWACAVEEVALAPGDTLLICSDGATEARSPSGEEYGDQRLERAMRRSLAVGPAGLGARLQLLIDDVRSFSGGCLSDDLTFVLARLRAPAIPRRLWASPEGTRSHG